MPTLITEAVNLTASTPKTGRIKLRIIDQGKGTSGTYPAATLEAAAKDKIFAKGTHMYADHMSATEAFDRPEGSIKNLAGVLESDAVYEDGALYAEAKVFPAWRDILDPEVFEHIGVSIRASAEVDEARGERTVTKLVHAESVDFVTKAGRGGRVMEVIESARVNTRAIRHGVAEATANDTREWLQSAVKASLDGDDSRWAWVRDFDDTNVWYEADGEDGTHTYQQGYTLSGNTAELTGDPVEVRVETRYTPITSAPADESKSPLPVPAGVQEKKEAATMATTTIEEAELATLRENASRATAAEAELKAEREARAAETKAARKTLAESIVAEAFGEDAPAFIVESAQLLAESENFDPEKLRTSATEAAAKIAEAGGAGTPRGVGESAPKETELTTESADKAIAQAFGRTIKEA